MGAENQKLDLRPRANPALLSFVVPCYNESEVLPLLRKRLEALAGKLPCSVEFIMVNDGSRDGTGQMLFAWAERDSRVKVLDFARNFGHQAAVTAGNDHASGDAVVIMDADLQDPPELVLQMLARYREGYDVVFAQRTSRQGETLLKRATAAGFYWIMRRFVHHDLPANAGDFRLMSRPAADALIHLREGQRFIRGMVAWLGFYQIAVEFERPPRAAGDTKYPMRKMLAFAWDAILSFSSAPLKLGTYLGFAAIGLGAVMGLYAVVRYFLFHDLTPGWPTLVVLQCVIGGAILICLGMIGEYVARIYDEIKHRPIYIVRRMANLDRRILADRAVNSSPKPERPDRKKTGSGRGNSA
jgi:dolichol-phosphate mannosyltransferase